VKKSAGTARQTGCLMKRAGILWFVAASVLIGRAMFCMCQADGMGTGVELICEDAGIGAEDAEKIRRFEQEKESGTEFTAWNEKKQLRVESMDGSRSVITDVMEINGSSEILFAGSILHTEDTAGCLIGVETAEELFGSRQAEGMEIRYGERMLTVRGVVVSPGHLLVVEVQDPDIRFRRITLKPSGKGAGQSGAKQFAAAYGLAVRQIRYDLFSGERFMEMIPGKWSDFTGWKQSVDRFGEDASLLLSAEKSSREEQYLLLYAKCAGWMIAGMSCLIIGSSKLLTWKERIWDKNEIQI
jgi:hypothetical protein